MSREYTLPLIAPQAIEDYLRRPLSDYSFLKQVPRAELRAHAARLGFRYVTEPRPCQLVANIIGAQEPHFLYYMDMGAGKSKAILDLVRFRKARGELQRTLFSAPEFPHLWAWEDQLREHAPDLSYVYLLGDRQERQELIARKADVYLINYAGLPVYMAEMIHRAGHGKLKVESEAAAHFASLFSFLLYEEIHRLRSHDSLSFRLCCWLSAGAPFHYATTGTPTGRDPMMLWPQFKMVDEGETFGALGMFRAAFFSAKKRYFGGGQARRFAGYDYQFIPERLPALNRIMRNRSIVYEEHELTESLQPTTRLKMPVHMTQEMRLYYDRIVGRMKEVRGDYQSLDSLHTRMRQCASGFLALKVGDDEEGRIEVEFRENPKLEALRQILIDLPAGEKVLIFHQFRYSGNRIRKLLDEMEIGYASLYGGLGHDKGRAEYLRFLSDRRCLAWILQNQVGSEASNPQQVCRYAWFYERPDDPLLSQQAEKRISGVRATRRNFIGDITVVGNRAEENLLIYLKESKDMRKAILSGEEAVA